MYLPPHFEETRPDQVQALIRTHPLGILVSDGPQGLDADHLPFEMEVLPGKPAILRAHVARANPAGHADRDGAEVLVIFRGEEAYVSPSWYPSKHERHRQVPTWNYRVVHAHGRLAIRDDDRYVRALIARLTRTHEAGQPRPWSMADAPRDFVDDMVKQIVGLEIEVTRWVAKSKLSQNKDLRDRQGAADALDAIGEGGLATAMMAAPPWTGTAR